MILGLINVESVAYLGESIRIDASRTIATPDTEIETFTIKPEASGTAYDCMDKRYLDYVYTSTGGKVITLSVNTIDSVFSPALTVVDPATLNLFSTDTDLIPFEPDVFKYIPDGWSKLTRLHKRAQDTILDFLDEKGIQKKDSSTGIITRYGADDLYSIAEVKSWSCALVLAYLFEGLSNQVDDIFSKKALKYSSLAEVRSNRASIQLKPTSDEAAPQDIRSFSSSRLVRG